MKKFFAIIALVLTLGNAPSVTTFEQEGGENSRHHYVPGQGMPS
jgi:hypothetical protein